MSFFNNFVNEYKEVLTMKKSHKDNNSKTNLIIKTLSLTLIMAVIALFTAIIFNTTKNLGYLFTMLNGIVLGSFIMYKALKETKIRATLKNDYKIRTLLVFDSLELIILLLSTSIIVFVVFLFGTSYFLIIIYASLLIFFMIVQAEIETMLKNSKFQITKLYQIVRGSLYLFMLYYVLSIIISPFNFYIGTIIIYLLISLIYFYKLVANDALRYLYKRKIYFNSGLLLIGLLAYSIVNKEVPYTLNPIGINVVENTNDNFFEATSKMVVTEDEIIVLQDNRIEFYSYDLELNHMINGTAFTEIHQWGDEIVVSYQESNDLNKDYCVDNVYYNIIDHELVLRTTSKVFDEGTFFYFEGNYVAGYNNGIGYVKDDCYFESITGTDHYTNDTIIEEKSTYVMLSMSGSGGIITNKDHTFRYGTPFEDDDILLYSNGHILMRMDIDGDVSTTDDQFLGLIETKDFLNQNTIVNQAKVINIGAYSKINYFYYSDDYVVITAVSSEELGRQEYTMIMNDTIQYTENFFNVSGASNGILVSSVDKGLKSLVIEDINQISYQKMSNQQNVFAWVTLCVMLFTTTPQLFFKGGVLDD